MSHQDSQLEKPGRGSHLHRHLSAPDCPLLFRAALQERFGLTNEIVFQGVLPSRGKDGFSRWVALAQAEPSELVQRAGTVQVRTHV